jgi:hypothetical protein
MYVSIQLVIRAWPHGAIEGVLWSWWPSVLKEECPENIQKVKSTEIFVSNC